MAEYLVDPQTGAVSVTRSLKEKRSRRNQSEVDSLKTRIKYLESRIKVLEEGYDRLQMAVSLLQ